MGKKRKKATPRQKINRRSRMLQKREEKRLGAKAVANTKHFWQQQTLGAASSVRRVEVTDEEREKYKPQPRAKPNLVVYKRKV